MDSLELTEQEEEALEGKLEEDENLGEEFKNYIVPHAIKYYLGENSSDEDSEEEDSSDDDSDDGNQPVGHQAALPGGASKPGRRGGDTDEQPEPECKQQ